MNAVIASALAHPFLPKPGCNALRRGRTEKLIGSAGGQPHCADLSYFSRLTDADHFILSGLPADWPYFLGYNRVRPSARGQTIFAIEDAPLLVVAERRSDLVSAFTSDCFPHWGSPAFMAWSGYTPFWDQLLGWLATRSA